MPRQRHAAAGESTQAQALANQPVALGVDRLPWLHIAGATAAGVCMMMPCLTAGMAMFATTRPGDMV